MALILASGSPRRRELLSLITPAYTVHPSGVEERGITADTPALLVAALAKAKCLDVAALYPADGDIVLGCDTVVDCDGRVFGKPASEAEAVAMLTALSGRAHQVHTGVCLCRGGPNGVLAAAVETTTVHFTAISPAELAAYAATAEPYDKAGGYAIQGHAALWCSGIVGCYYNIMGLPVHRVAQLLRQLRG
ncbi:MAG: Maf family protein [Gemmiger sp.]|nr:Maf family protein [Gemmiger sp.]